MTAAEKAKELGATIEGGINWTHAKGFTSPAHGQEFVQWLEANGYETRGYNPAQPESENDLLHMDSVRFRK
jgi:hypothetical protein